MMTLYTGGFSRFIASTAAPIATDWSENRRAGFAPAGKPCLCTAHKFTYANEENALKRLHLQLHEPNAVSRKRPFLTLLRKVLKLPSFTSKSVSEVVLNSMSD